MISNVKIIFIKFSVIFCYLELHGIYALRLKLIHKKIETNKRR